MLTRFVRTQLMLFTIASIVGVAVMVFAYIQLPTLLGAGRLTAMVNPSGPRSGARPSQPQATPACVAASTSRMLPPWARTSSAAMAVTPPIAGDPNDCTDASFDTSSMHRTASCS